MREIIAEESTPRPRVSLSHEVYPRWREYDRTSTTLADAFLKTLVRDYIENLAGGLGARRRRRRLPDHEVERRRRGSSRGRGEADRPAGVRARWRCAERVYFGQLTGRRNLISMDMGGTSFDVSLIADGEANRTTEFEIEWGLPVYTPMVDVKHDRRRRRLDRLDRQGRPAAGRPAERRRATRARPATARGGTEPTVTDANLALGRINPRLLPRRRDAARRRRRRDARSASSADALGHGHARTSPPSIIELVNFNMVNAIRLVSIDRGLDPRDFTLVSFGGAGSLHAARPGRDHRHRARCSSRSIRACSRPSA